MVNGEIGVDNSGVSGGVEKEDCADTDDKERTFGRCETGSELS